MRSMRARLLLFVLLLTSCAARYPLPQMTPEVARQREEQLAAARREYERDPNDANAIIWLGRRTAYLGRYGEAIAIFTEGIRKHPRDARIYRHRGHRYITIRKFDRAIEDFVRADELTRGMPDEIEPDGLPNERNTPIGSLQSNICYHHGLAWYLKGDFARALPIYQRCNELSTNPDRLVSTTHWLYMTLRRLGREEDAKRVLEPIREDLDIIENGSYHKLTLMYAGRLSAEELLREQDPAILYGVGNWLLYNGERGKALEVFQRIIDGKQWAAFGYIAAEQEL